MIKRIISLKPVGAKAQEARQFAKEVNDFINKKHPKISSEVYMEKYGEVGTIYFIALFESIGQMEETMAATGADEKYQVLATKGLGLFVDGSLKMTLMETF
jgi:hypothetical protein